MQLGIVVVEPDTIRAAAAATALLSLVLLVLVVKKPDFIMATHIFQKTTKANKQSTLINYQI